MSLPTIIQGGMGAGVSYWKLAQSVSSAGHLGVVAGTALDVILARRLQLGDPGGHMRRALDHFPVPAVAQWIIERYFIEGGKEADVAFRPLPLIGEQMTQERTDLTVAANFAEVYLAREGHSNPVGINYLEKIQFPTLPSLFGAMLGGVGYVLMGAGIPVAIPGIIDSLAEGQAVELGLDVHGADRKYMLNFDPSPYLADGAAAILRPKFLAIVSSVTIASVMIRKGTGRTDGLIIEGSSAGGHNAPPRGRLALDDTGQPVYGERDIPNIPAIAALDLPFWLAGSCGSPEQLTEALEQGATGVQVGTAFAFSQDSGLDPDLRRRALDAIVSGEASVFTDAKASPTGFPFKVLDLAGTLSRQERFEARPKICDLGYLRQAYQSPEGKMGWRCSSEPEKPYEKKGGDLAQTIGRKCVCNGLLANIGMPQVKKSGELEQALLTCGDDIAVVRRMVDKVGIEYRAADVLAYLTGASGA